MMTSIMCTKLEEKLKEIRSHLLRRKERNVAIECLCGADKRAGNICSFSLLLPAGLLAW